MDVLGRVPPVFSGLCTSNSSPPDLRALCGLDPDTALHGSEIPNVFFPQYIYVKLLAKDLGWVAMRRQTEVAWWSSSESMLPGRTGLPLCQSLVHGTAPGTYLHHLSCVHPVARGPTGSRLFLVIWFLLKVLIPSLCLASGWVAELSLLLCLSNNVKGGIVLHSREVFALPAVTLTSPQVRQFHANESSSKDRSHC